MRREPVRNSSGVDPWPLLRQSASGCCVDHAEGSFVELLVSRGINELTQERHNSDEVLRKTKKPCAEKSWY